MREWLAILFALQILSNAFFTPFVSYFQIDEFVEHSSFHSDAYGDSLFTFFIDHYITGHHSLPDHPDDAHDNLPNNIEAIQSSSIYYLAMNHFDACTSFFAVDAKKPSIFISRLVSSSFTRLILQPPQSL